ncbi:MAG TPA: sigma factor-like helix-turn-helix DNA-binding protein, partial [Propionibacteriaceae bacterium]|nr:sigma factor-like helix-turn-helix DNA-binding protein [Propionibacteriaceae bacterium]
HLIHEVLCLISVAGRELITMKYLDRRSTNEIAEATGRTPAAVSQALSRAKRELARALDGNPALLKELRAPMPRAH